jgi:hypothetical protein
VVGTVIAALTLLPTVVLARRHSSAAPTVPDGEGVDLACAAAA